MGQWNYISYGPMSQGPSPKNMGSSPTGVHCRTRVEKLEN